MQYAFERPEQDRPQQQDRPDIQELVERVRKVRSQLSVGIELEVSTERTEECAVCGGSGEVPMCAEHRWTPCPRCGGRGQEPHESEECAACQGDGRRGRCSACLGEGCRWCEHTGRAECPYCWGRGRRPVQCRECEGTGDGPCPKCGEVYTEVVECEECGGEGQIPVLDMPAWANDVHDEHCGTEFSGLFVPSRPGNVVATEEEFLDWAVAIARTAEEGGTYGPCGLHVHIGPGSGEEWTPEEVSAAVRIWRLLEPFIWAAAEPKSERIPYCEPNENYPVEPNEYVSRYRAMNAWPAWREHGTVEFRLWNACEDSDYVAMAILVSATVMAIAWVMTENGAEWDRNKILTLFRESLPGWVVDWVETAAGVSLREAV